MKLNFDEKLAFEALQRIIDFYHKRSRTLPPLLRWEMN